MVVVVMGVDFIFAIGTLYVSKVAAADEQALAGGIFNVSTREFGSAPAPAPGSSRGADN